MITVQLTAEQFNNLIQSIQNIEIALHRIYEFTPFIVWSALALLVILGFLAVEVFRKK